MSLEIVRSIRGAFGDSRRKQADKLLHSLNDVLRSRGLPEFKDSDPDESALRRLPCGSAGSGTFHALNQLAVNSNLAWSLSRHRTEYWIALPIRFDEPFSIQLGRLLLILPYYQEFQSLPVVHSEIIALAKCLAIPLQDGLLSDEHAARILDCESLTDSEPAGFMENERGLWLDLYQASRYCMEDGTPLVIT